MYGSGNTLTGSPARLSVWPDSSGLLAQFLAREKSLVIYALIMFALAAVFVVASWIDDRQWREVSLWSKPLKFALSTAVFALTTAWWIGLLPADVRHGGATTALVWTLIITASFEVVYISAQAAIGQGSHHNTSTPFHAAMFGLMAIAAVALTATQAWLAVMIASQYRDQPMPADVLAVVIGLGLTTVLGTISGMALGGNQPPAGSGMLVFGWHLGLQDYRPAHFLGIHAHQFVPLAGLAVTAASAPWPHVWVIGIGLLYGAAWMFLM